jgi:hypothetical protein
VQQTLFAEADAHCLRDIATPIGLQKSARDVTVKALDMPHEKVA